MSLLKRPPRQRKGGLTFSSAPQKRQRSASPIPIPTKRNRLSPIDSTETTIQTRVLVISDTHGVSALPQILSHDLKIDVVLHCGDLSECGTLEDTEDGKKLHDEAREIWTSASVKEAGIELLAEGIHEFALDNGARLRIYASPYTINSQRVTEWGFGYGSGENRFNSEGEGISYGKAVGTEESVLNGDKEVDVIMTHGPARYRLDLSSGSESLGCPHLFRAMRRIRPKLHVFGHVHNAYGAEIVRWEDNKHLPEDDHVDDGIQAKTKTEGFVEDGVKRIGISARATGAETVFVNAALMGRDGVLENVPWLVDVGLEPV
ncbi:uncharacterized protein LY89DRAFT_719120 [Mollisia scopiformis]|uniref:Calcineurin-like phosphoesterase domain-containing protein n=1 Tax=Mollisia scopiformis TaxID=149040 RepID=A0A194X8A0_MOLSC|nr:uncharacterized protein LY89DRAFT_719120 [Mollisia scopiformis]KUJ16395.1 hypothetical protein LY89DRAFT_719120 [Mollisia scopiformis]